MPDFIEPNEVPAETSRSKTPVIGEATKRQLKQHAQTGAQWFFWIAALSLVNTVLALGGAERRFIVGLYVTAIVDAVAVQMGKQQPAHSQILMGVSIGFSVLVSLLAMGVGWLSRKGVQWVFAIGIGLYLLDGLLWLLLGDFASAAFHAFALVFMVRGFLAFRQLATVNSENVVDQAGVDQANDDADDTEEWLKSVGQRDA